MEPRVYTESIFTSISTSFSRVILARLKIISTVSSYTTRPSLSMARVASRQSAASSSRDQVCIHSWIRSKILVNKCRILFSGNRAYCDIHNSSSLVLQLSSRRASSCLASSTLRRAWFPISGQQPASLLTCGRLLQHSFLTGERLLPTASPPLNAFLLSVTSRHVNLSLSGCPHLFFEGEDSISHSPHIGLYPILLHGHFLQLSLHIHYLKRRSNNEKLAKTGGHQRGMIHDVLHIREDWE